MSETSKALIFRVPQFEEQGARRLALSDSDVEETSAHKDLSIVDIESLKKLLKSDDIIKDYNKYCDESAKRISQQDSQKMLLFIKLLRDVNSEESLERLIRESGYHDFDDPQELREYIEKRIETYNKMLESYKEMLEHNYKALKISTDSYKKLSKSLNVDTGKKLSKSLDTIMDKLEKNRRLWERSWGCDFTKLNGGKVFMNPKENVWEWAHNIRTLYNHSLKFDVILLCHGTNLTPGKHLSDEEIRFIEKYEKLSEKYSKKLSKKELEDLKKEMTEEDRKIVEKYSKNLNKLLDQYDVMMNPYRYYNNYGFKLFLYVKDRLKGNLKKNWGFAQPLTTEYGTFRDVNECIRACIANGNKRIQVMACNPGHYQIADDIKKMTDVRVSYQRYCVLTESYDEFNGETLTEGISLKSIKEKVGNFLKSFKEKSKKILSVINPKDKLNMVIINIKNKRASLTKLSSVKGDEVIKTYETANNEICDKIEELQINIKKLQIAKSLINSSAHLRK